MCTLHLERVGKMSVNKVEIANASIGHIMHELRFVLALPANELSVDAKLKLQRMYLLLSDVSDYLVNPDAENADAGNHITE